MSPLARSLLALACAALLHASSADNQRLAALPDLGVDKVIRFLSMGYTVNEDKYIESKELPNFIVKPKNRTDFLFEVPNVAQPDETLVGQYLMVASTSKEMTLKPVTNGKHSPIQVHCEPGCETVFVMPNQYVINKLE